MEEARVDGALIVQPINHKFDHSLVTRSHLFFFYSSSDVIVVPKTYETICFSHFVLLMV